MTRTREIYVPPQGPPQGQGPNPEIYQVMGEENIYRMLEDFYTALAQSSIKEMFPSDSVEKMRLASRRSADFFIFILGGPPLYHQKHGPPMMRKRHLPFEIDEAARIVWIDSFKQILAHAEERYQFPKQHLEGFIEFLEGFSSWMVNAR